MKERTSLDEGFDSVVLTTAARLKPLGFSRRGPVFRLVRDGMSGVIQFQRSTKSSRELVLFTVNVGVVCGRLLPARVPLRTATSMDSHVGHRLGFLSSGEFDKWWPIDLRTDAAALGTEVTEAIVAHAVPFIEQHMSVDALRTLWESGRSPGMTDGARRDLLARLNAAEPRHQADERRETR